MKANHIILTLLVLASLTSCVTNKKLTYLQDEMANDDTIKSVTPSAYKILPFDNLFIRVVTPDPNLSAMFNTIPVASNSVTVTEQSVDMVSYTVDIDGYILLPYAGRILVEGKTLNAVTAEVEKILKEYIADAAITVKLVNNYVSLLGEVQRPGKYPIYKERMNIFQALAMAGDLGDFSDRQKLQFIRPTPHGNIIKEISLNDRSIMTSEFFFVLPNDVIYAKPVKGRFFRLNTFPYSTILSTITTFVLLMTVIK